MKTFPIPVKKRKKEMPRPIDGFLPKTVVVPLRQEFDYSCISCVVPGQTVREGDVIAIPKAKLRARIHSPVPGTVRDIILSELPDGKQEAGIQIDLMGAFSYLGKRKRVYQWNSKLPDEIISEIAQKGVVNTFLATNPCSLAYQIHDKKFGPRRKILIVRLFDESPTRITDTVLYDTFPKEVLEGTDILAYAANISGIVFLHDKKQKSPISESEQEKSFIPVASIAVDSNMYYSGFTSEMANIVRTSLKYSPFSEIGDNDLYVDASTMMSVCSAIADDIPVVRRYVTIDGDCVLSCGLINVTLGMSIRDAIEQCGGLVKKPKIIIVNGIMTGTSTPSLDTPITKYVKSISLISSRDVYDELESECTGCGSCRKVCPHNLSPDILYEYATGIRMVEDFFLRSADICTFCDLCNAVCPSRLPISQTIYAFFRQGKKL